MSSDPRPELRAGDADRERVAAELRAHCAAGRLSLDELDERLAAAYAARTYGELRELTLDLPVHEHELPVPASTTLGRPAARRRSPSGQLSPQVAQWLAGAVFLVLLFLTIGLGSETGFWPVWPIGAGVAGLAAGEVRRRARR